MQRSLACLFILGYICSHLSGRRVIGPLYTKLPAISRARCERGNWPGGEREMKNLSLDRELPPEIASAGGTPPAGLRQVQGLPKGPFFNTIMLGSMFKEKMRRWRERDVQIARRTKPFKFKLPQIFISLSKSFFLTTLFIIIQYDTVILLKLLKPWI